MADGLYFENFKPSYLRNRLRYRNEILHGDAWRHSAAYQQL